VSNPADYPYATFLDVKFPPLAVRPTTKRWERTALKAA